MKRLLIIAGPSAVGKTTLIKHLISENKDLEYSRSATTREKRGDGQDSEYVYLSVSDFISEAQSGGMLEYTEYAGNFYGTPKSEIERILKKGKTPLLVLDKEGVGSIKNDGEYPSFAVYLYEKPEVLEERLSQRYIGGHSSPEGLAKFIERKERNLSELTSVDAFECRFDLLLRNVVPEKCAKEIISAYAGEYVPDKTAAISELKALLDN